MSASRAAKAWSYLRWSSAGQSTGDTRRRQTEARDAWLKARPQIHLAEEMLDAGRSAFKRKDFATYALGQFVDRVKAGKIPAGSYLLLENLDRLSREDAGTAVELLLSLVNRGIIVVQLMPEVTEFRKPVDMLGLMRAVVELSRGHSESAAKSNRSKANWTRLRKDAKSGKRMTRRVPGWIDFEPDGVMILHPTKAATVKRLFALVLGGESLYAIAQRLNAEKVPTIGRAVMKGRVVLWDASTVTAIVRNPACVGQFVPYGTDRKQAPGEPIENYYPAAVDHETFNAVAKLLKAPAKRAGRRGQHVNLFGGLLQTHAGDSLTYSHMGTRSRVVPTAAMNGRTAVWLTFPSVPLEEAVLWQLREVTPDDVTGGNRSDETSALKSEIARLESVRSAWADRMDDLSIIDTVSAKLRETEAAIRKARADLAELGSAPAAESAGELATLYDMLRADPSDECRLKIRAAIRGAVARIVLYVLPDGLRHLRRGVTQVWFRAGGCREYLICARAGRGERKATWSTQSFRGDAGDEYDKPIDFADTKDRKAVEEMLHKLT